MGLKLLVVEDDSPTLELMHEGLAALESDVHALNDSRQAAALIEREPFDGIFLDLQMPEVDGFDLARRIRQSPWNRTTPIMVVTGEDTQAMQKVFALGATFFLQKPIDRQKLSRLFRAAAGPIAENQLRLKRVPLQVDVRCTIGSATIAGRSVDLRRSGILIACNNYVEPGTQVRLSLRLPSQDLMINCAGVVARVDEARRIAVRFTDVNLRDRQLIREFLEGWQNGD